MNNQSNQFYPHPKDVTGVQSHDFSPYYQKTKNGKRILIFFIIFITGSLICTLYSYHRPAVYQCDAKLMIESASSALRIQDTSPQKIALQTQVLLSRELLSKVVDDIGDENMFSELAGMTIPAMRSMIQVQTIPDSAIIKLVVRGPDSTVLPVIVNTWMACYVDLNSQIVKDNSEETRASLESQLETIKTKVSLKRNEIEVFKKEHDIVSMSREENTTLSKLRGLTESLNKASEARVIAEANLKAIQNAIKANKWAGNYTKNREMERYEEQADLLQEKLNDLETRYTPKFIEMDKDARLIVKKLNILTEKIKIIKQEIQAAALESAEQEITSSLAAEENLKKQIIENKTKVSAFSQKFSKYEALKQDLQGLEELQRTVQEKLVGIEIKSDTDRLEVRILETAVLPEKSAFPYYERDAGIGVGASLLLAISCLLLYDFLTKPEKKNYGQEGYPVNYTQILQSPTAPNQIGYHNMPEPSRIPLTNPVHFTELSEAEVYDIHTHADHTAQLCIAALFNGLTRNEIVLLQWHHISLEDNEIRTPGGSTRILKIFPHFRILIEKEESDSIDSNHFLIRNEQGKPITIDAMEEKILSAAVKASLNFPDFKGSFVLRNTYIAFLARQGVPLSEIIERVGHIPAEFHRKFESLHPSGVLISIQEAKTQYPAFKE